MLVATATCSNLPAWEVDDQPLHAALVKCGVEVVQPAWDDPAFDWSSCDACLIRTTWDYMDRRDEYLAWARRVAAVTKLYNSYELVRWNTHKGYLRDLESRGVPVAPTVWIETGSSIDLRGVLAEKGWQKAFLKPVIGATARETLRFEATQAGIEAASRHLRRMLVNESMILQPYLASVETEGELSVIMIDGEFTHAVRKTPVAGDYRVQNDFGAADKPVTLQDGELNLAREIVEKIDVEWLYARVDFLRDRDGELKLSELELVEPSLFFRHCPQAADHLAACLCRRL